jgi:glycosyltransferase involved in cell wall biosynthesis
VAKAARVHPGTQGGECNPLEAELVLDASRDADSLAGNATKRGCACCTCNARRASRTDGSRRNSSNSSSFQAQARSKFGGSSLCCDRNGNRHHDEKYRTHVTLSGVSDDFAPVERNAGVLAGCGLVPGRRYILVVGQFAPYKNHDGAIRAFAAACTSIEDIDLVLVQRQGPSSAALLKLARQLGVGDRVRLTGPVERAELVQLYSSAEFLLHPSLCESFGNPVLEAMACGCPVVTSSISAMPEVAGGGRFWPILTTLTISPAR